MVNNRDPDDLDTSIQDTRAKYSWQVTFKELCKACVDLVKDPKKEVSRVFCDSALNRGLVGDEKKVWWDGEIVLQNP